MTQYAPKTAVVCMVHNGYEYLSEFLLYHLNLCDHLFIIDHNSERDLRALQLDRVTFVRSNHEAQFQSECTNIVVEKLNIKRDYDWLFVLDIDEFLPFKDKAGFHAFLNKYKQSVLQFQWCNGVPFYGENEQPRSLIDCDSIRFFHKDSPNHKTFVNIKKTKGNFVVPTGAHRVDGVTYPLLSKKPLRRKYKRYEPAMSEVPLLHIVAFNKNAFIKKIRIYVEQMKYREHIKGQGGWVVRDYPSELDDDQWLWYIANFRVADTTQHYEFKTEYFIEQDVFSHLNKEEANALHNRIFECGVIQKIPAGIEEKQYLSYKHDDSDVVGNIKWFDINPQNEIITVVPRFYRRKALS